MPRTRPRLELVLLLAVLLLPACGDDPAAPGADDPLEADLISPHDPGDPVSAPFVVTVTASGDVAAVEFTVDDTVVAVDRHPPFAFLWNLALWADDGWHWLRARALGADGDHADAGALHQRIPAGTPGVLTWPGPAGGQADSTRAVLRWRADPLAAGYLVEVSRTPDFSGGVRRADAPDTTCTMPVDGHAWYHWRVRSRWDQPEAAPWSETGTFYAGAIFERGYPVGGANRTAGLAVDQAEDGGYLVAGYRDRDPNGLVQKFDALGEPLWLFSPYLDAWFEDVVTTTDGGCVIAGRVISGGLSRLLLLELDATGQEVWRRDQYGGPEGAHGRRLIRCGAGGYLVAGGRDGQAWLVRTDDQGRLLWETTLPGDHLDGVAETPSGSVLVTGEWRDGFFVLAEVGAGGETLWVVTDWSAPGRDLVVEPAGCAVLVSSRFQGGVRRFDADGGLLAEQHLGYEFDELVALAPLPGGGYRILGDAGEVTLSDGLQITGHRPLPGRTAAHAATADGGFVLTGQRGEDLWVLKANPDGAWQPPDTAAR